MIDDMAGWDYDLQAAPLRTKVLAAVNRERFSGYPRVVAAYRIGGNSWSSDTTLDPLSCIRGAVYAWRPLLLPPPLPAARPTTA
jgi:hypothetical protein